MRAVQQGRNTWCVPAVLSILTGKDTDHCSQILARLMGQDYNSQVTWVPRETLIRACRDLKMDVVEKPIQGYSMYSALVALCEEPGMYIVGVRRHVVAVEVTADKKIYFCDNHTKEPINAGSAARLGQRVENIYKVTPKPDPVLLSREWNVGELVRTYYLRENWSGSVRRNEFRITCKEE